MTVYKIVVAYDGTAYHGWQSQSNATTVCQTLQQAFTAVFFQPISILAASRTDKGVHALGQVAIARTPLDLDLKQLLKVWNKILPSDIVVLDIEKLEHLVHPHDGVVQKIYAYHFFVKRPMPFVARYGWQITRAVDIKKLEEVVQVFQGTHDFRSFCSGNDLLDTVRKIDAISISYVPSWEAYRIEFKGKSFLRYMVRRIVGACLEIASRETLRVEHAKDILLKKNPEHTLPNAPAKGLVLERIIYDSSREI